MGKFATQTSVSVDRSRMEIETMLAKYGASQFGYATDTIQGLATIQFFANSRHVRFLLRMPPFADFALTPSKKARRSPGDQLKAWEQACRQRWRALLLCVKAKLEAVECGITDFETEFMPHIVLPNGQTVGQLMRPQIDQAYLSGETPSGIAGYIGVSS